MSAILIVAIMLAIVIVLFVYVLVTPNVKSETFLLSKNSTLDPNLQKALNFFGGDVSALIPDSAKKKKRRNRKLQKLFITSGNPWNINANEFLVIQVFLSAAGILVGVIAALLLQNSVSLFMLICIVLGLGILGYTYPIIYYRSIADDRIKAFKRELPEAIDYLVIAMSGGAYGLPSAIERVIKYLPKGVMKDEFSKIIDSLNSGKSLSKALDEFAQRAPTEGIEAFVNSLNNAHKLNAPVAEILKNRSEASRAELNAEIDKKIATLSTKVLLVFGPMAYSSILIVVLAPTASSLLSLLS